MRRFILLFALLLITACQTATASELSTRDEGRRQPVIMLDAYGWRYERGHVVQEHPGNVYLSLPNLAHGSHLKAVSVRYQGPPGHTGEHEVSKPALWVWQQDATGAEQVLGNQPDTTDSMAYLAPHWITAHLSSYTVDLKSYHYFARVTSEQGTGWLPGGRVIAVMVEAE